MTRAGFSSDQIEHGLRMDRPGLTGWPWFGVIGRRSRCTEGGGGGEKGGSHGVGEVGLLLESRIPWRKIRRFRWGRARFMAVHARVSHKKEPIEPEKEVAMESAAAAKSISFLLQLEKPLPFQVGRTINPSVHPSKPSSPFPILFALFFLDQYLELRCSPLGPDPDRRLEPRENDLFSILA
ncbi:hypothetical protein Cni_G15123 [Canna indica]|uniref:Uncharacterized protein n=1 Tax=Canna indica TaxID=4628 RepID=A0AAQ3QCZ9_9LILI|nr:hypothetical protein Cni_G15123 [Canna indica]